LLAHLLEASLATAGLHGINVRGHFRLEHSQAFGPFQKIPAGENTHPYGW